VAHVTDAASSTRRWLLPWYGLAAVFAVFTYFYGLDSTHIPKNGDEYPYEHITRLTAASGNWLPLQSDIPEMRNTKPPLLFWQGIVSTDWGRDWTLWNLRWPSVVYTLLTAGLALLLAWRLSGQLETGLVALLTFLAFFSTYRYGRPFLTDPPSTFWLFLPCFAMLWRPGIVKSRVIAPLLLGLVTGIGLLYKSFALLLPVGLCLAWWHLHRRRHVMTTFLARDASKLVIIAVVALAVFSLWFALDPDPRAIVNEFVFKENAGKFGAPGDYVKNFFWGGSSIWRLVVSYPLNAGLLIFPVVALFVDAFRRRAELRDGERLLWTWVITLFVVFSLPSQRDERYLLPAMPALAVLCALNWERISDRAFKATLIVTAVVIGLLAYLSLRLDQAVPGERLYPIAYWALLMTAAAGVVVPFLRPKLTRACVNVAILLALLTFAGFLRPFDGAAGTFDARAQRLANGRTVWVPINFVAKEESYRFLLPGADVRPYPFDPNQPPAELVDQYHLVAVRLPMNAPPVSGGTVLGQRLDIGTRHTPEQIMDMVRGHVFEHLFVKELLLEADDEHRR
jgi:4-amino-4-deoxy-L-arabinose transferase-like glycosyltransferase